MNPDPLDRLNGNGIAATVVVYYAALYPRLREVARQHGYALTLHGSLTNDLDVVAVPWVEDATETTVLVEAIVEAAGGFLVAGKDRAAYARKPHGRTAWTIHLGGAGGYIDLSVMPRSPAAEQHDHDNEQHEAPTEG